MGWRTLVTRVAGRTGPSSHTGSRGGGERCGCSGKRRQAGTATVWRSSSSVTRRRAMKKIVGMVLAGGRVDELLVLTAKRPKSALPMWGVYRIIDFVLSNMMHAGIEVVG